MDPYGRFCGQTSVPYGLIQTSLNRIGMDGFRNSFCRCKRQKGLIYDNVLFFHSELAIQV